ncbi:hypothetical protein [Bacteroides neonati]|uniref:hypothetical protein n=1 Tax=Bacteroides neonati TaxID=1347393 RepID=UPI0005A73DED|nr:hypothetical protein [Bacteroides neonati]
MKNIVYIDGTVVVERCMFYSKDIMIYAGDEFKANAEIITPPEGILRIKEDYGSIFTYYYIKGDFVIYGVEDGNAVFFFDNHDFTYNLYKENIAKVRKMIESIVASEDLVNLFFQQQFISIFGALENFLFNTFMRQVCNNYNLYNRVISRKVKILVRDKKSEARKILDGKDCLNKEKVFIEKVQRVVFHNQEKVTALYEAAFDVNPGMANLEPELKIRHDLVHRIGYTIDGALVLIDRKQIDLLLEKVDSIVEKVTCRIRRMNV